MSLNGFFDLNFNTHSSILIGAKLGEVGEATGKVVIVGGSSEVGTDTELSGGCRIP